MKNSEEMIVKRFREIKALGFVKSKRRHNTGIGKTFEDYIGVHENNISAPDFADFEIKAHREESQSYITLFTKSPSFPRRANTFLRDNFGISDEENQNLKKLFSSMFATRLTNTTLYPTLFKLINDRVKEEIRIGVYDKKTEKLIREDIGYTYLDIQKKLSTKLKKLFYVKADPKNKDECEYFHFTSADIYTNPSMENFLKLIDSGKIMYDIRIGSYASGTKYGKLHDHGSGFRILEQDLPLLYERHRSVD